MEKLINTLTVKCLFNIMVWCGQLVVFFYIQLKTEVKDYLWKRFCVLLQDTNTGV